jgi:hypothetical protein
MKRTFPVVGSIALAIAVLVAIAAVVATPVGAAKGGKRGGGGGGTTPVTGGCTVNPNPVAVYGDFTVSGSGYAPGQYVTLVITSSGGTSYRWAQADSSGSWSAVSRVYTAGSNSVRVHDSITGTQIGGCSFSSY